MRVTKVEAPHVSAEETRRLSGWWRGLNRHARGVLAALAALLAVLLVLGLAGCGAKGPDAAAASAAAAQTDSGAKVRVVTSFYAMEDFAKRVGGDDIEVTNLVPAGTEPHDWEPSATDMQTIQDADLFVYNGASMEHWVDDTLSSLGSQAPKAVKASDGIQLLAGDHHDHGDAATDAAETVADGATDKAEVDPHVWLNPENAKVELANIRDALSEVDPAHKDDYAKNFETYAAKMDQLDKDFRDRLSGVPNKTIVVAHEAFGYLCDAYGLTQVPITGMDAEGEPDAQTMASIIDQVKSQNIKVIFSEDLVSPKVAKQIADATGATCEVLSPIEGLTDEQIAQGEDYFSVMESNLDELMKALS